MKKVIVIGGGIVGISTSIWLQRAGHKVTIIDRGVALDRASYGNGGVLASSAIVPVNVPGLMRKAPGMLLNPGQPLFVKWSYLPKLAPWLMRYISHCRPEETLRIAAALNAIIGDSLQDHQLLAGGTPAARRIRPSDYVFIYDDKAHYDSDASSWSVRRSLGFEWDELQGDAWKAHDPVFSPDLKFAACLKNHGMIDDPGAYLADLTDYFVKQGGQVLKGEADDVVHENRAVSGVRIGGETIPANAVVIAGGAWSAELTRKLGLNIPLESERGYHLELWEPNLMPRGPVMIVGGKFVVTPMEGRLRVAGIVEFGGLKKPPSKAPFSLLRNSIRAALPGLTWKRETRWMGHRPAPADSIPLIGEVPGLAGAYLGFGHHHVGLTGGPRTGQLLAQLISGNRPNIDLSPYAPARFA
tara:strand:- start:166546 stop:167784 length:1239 start_codon:yes stop_codon:yes gene_type:complete